MVNFIGVYTVVISCFFIFAKKMECEFIVVFRSRTPLKKSRKLILILYFFNILKKKGGVDMERYIEIKIAEYPERTDQGLAWVVVYKIIYL